MKVGEFFNLDENPSWCITGLHPTGYMEHIFPTCPACGGSLISVSALPHNCLSYLKRRVENLELEKRNEQVAAENAIKQLEEQRAKNREINELKDFLGYGDIFDVLLKIKKRWNEVQETNKELLKSYKEKCAEFDEYQKMSIAGADASFEKIRNLERQLKQKTPEQVIDSAIDKFKTFLNEFVTK
jgi:hypothetical protein